MTELVYVGSKRTIYALDLQTGAEVWHTRLPRLWGSQTTILVDGEALLVTRGSYVYRLDRWTGEILWEHAVSESPGYLLMLATASGSAGSQQGGAAGAQAQQAAMMAAAGGAAAVAAASG